MQQPWPRKAMKKRELIFRTGLSVDLDQPVISIFIDFPMLVHNAAIIRRVELKAIV